MTSTITGPVLAAAWECGYEGKCR